MRYYKRVDATGKTTTVESYSHDAIIPGAVAINKAEFDEYIAALPVVLFESDFEKLLKRIVAIEDKIKAV